MTRVGLVVHSFFPHVGGSEAHVRWMAGSLRERGFSPLVITRRAPDEPRFVDGLDISSAISDALSCDIVLTYSASTLTLEVGAILRSVGTRRPPWVHHPCAVGRFGLDLIRGADCILALNSRDIELASLVCGNTKKVVRAFPGAHHERRGCPGRFRHHIGCEYVLWVGAWSPAKGARNMSERFASLRERHHGRPLKLVMFGAYGSDEPPISNGDIVAINGNWADVPDAIADCVFVAFNSPGPPVGYDANPMILLETLMNAKTFVAQSGTPFVSEIASLGLVIETDDQWIQGAQTLLLNHNRRTELEKACADAYRARYNLAAMMDTVQRTIRQLLEP